MRITRGVGERQRTQERVQRPGEQVMHNERLQNIHSAEDAARFDAEWRERASGALPPASDWMHTGLARSSRQGPSLGYYMQ